jgi:hypothetical protein
MLKNTYYSSECRNQGNYNERKHPLDKFAKKEATTRK